jgi:hypothetical protein
VYLDGTGKTQRLWDAISPRDAALIGGANLMMLVFGFLGETGRMDRYVACLLGFAFFAIAFRLLYVRYAKHSAHGRRLYAYMAALWTVYGIAYLLPVASKNAVFNVVDVFAKNFFSMFLSYALLA